MASVKLPRYLSELTFPFYVFQASALKVIHNMIDNQMCIRDSFISGSHVWEYEIPRDIIEIHLKGDHDI